MKCFKGMKFGSWQKKRRQEYLEMKFVCSEKSKKSRVHFPACCYTTKTRPKARKENIMPDQNHIVIQGLCQNNLKNISLKIPKQKLVVFTGVSGSGKSSIVFDTIAAESQRQMNETYSAFVRGRLPKYDKPKAERIENLSPSIIIDQNTAGAGGARADHYG